MSNTQNLKGKKIAILATNGFEQSELIQPRDKFIEQGAEVDVLSIDDQSTIKAWDEDNWGKEISVDKDGDIGQKNMGGKSKDKCRDQCMATLMII